jgi:hypothetical protein
MEHVAVQKKQTGGTPSVVHALWDPFWLMREMFGWALSVDAPAVDAKETDAPAVEAKETTGAPSLKETDGAYVCKFKLTLPDQADVARVTAELDNGELTIIVPKAAAATPEPASPPPRARQPKKRDGRGSPARTPRRGARSRSRRA